MGNTTKMVISGIDITDLHNFKSHIDFGFILESYISLCDFIEDYSFFWECPIKRICYS